MKKYRIVYGKSGLPLAAYRDSLEEAVNLANRLSFVGYYYVNIWEVTEAGAKEIKF